MGSCQRPKRPATSATSRGAAVVRQHREPVHPAVRQGSEAEALAPAPGLARQDVREGLGRHSAPGAVARSPRAGIEPGGRAHARAESVGAEDEVRPQRLALELDLRALGVEQPRLADADEPSHRLEHRLAQLGAVHDAQPLGRRGRHAREPAP
ncbi:hypothetical protein USB125703_01466 [Pseudoclavibacter triregionum]|nr:hypothetical protein USB125703_01466 [Pseudoclavibacter triregionum]